MAPKKALCLPMNKIKAFIKGETVFCIALAAAAVSCFFVPLDAAYIGYIDFRTLALLYCLMLVVGGLGKTGLYRFLAYELCHVSANVRMLGTALVGLCFVSSMLITNDVALITFVPFSVMVLGMADAEDALIPVVVLQTVAANLGSMLTPVGNPQNLYLYSYFGFGIADFLKISLPVWLLSAALLFLFCRRLKTQKLSIELEKIWHLNKAPFRVYIPLFVLCLLVVFRVLPWQLMLAVTVAVLLFYDRELLKTADYVLLLTFVCFFVFSGNLARIDSISALIRSVMAGREYLISVLTSQVISNVPAAILLSGFTDNAKALLLGVDIGGLGTPVASLASLISYKLYAHSKGADGGRYMRAFFAVNFLLLVILSLFAFLIL